MPQKKREAECGELANVGAQGAGRGQQCIAGDDPKQRRAPSEAIGEQTDQGSSDGAAHEQRGQHPRHLRLADGGIDREDRSQHVGHNQLDRVEEDAQCQCRDNEDVPPVELGFVDPKRLHSWHVVEALSGRVGVQQVLIRSPFVLECHRRE